MKRLVTFSAISLALAACGQQPGAKAAPNAITPSSGAPQDLCVNAETRDQLKAMAFDAARRLRGTNEVKLNDLERQSTSNLAMPLLQSHDEVLDRTICSGRLRIDPPVGARSLFSSDDLVADITYSMQPAADGTGLVYQVDDFGPIPTSIAYSDLSRFTSSENRPAGAAPVPVPAAAPAPPASVGSPAAPGRASFDCSLARTQVELLICATPKLGVLDRRMASLYAERRRAQPGSGDEQLAWIAVRNQCGDVACLYDVYQNRISELSY